MQRIMKLLICGSGDLTQRVLPLLATIEAISHVTVVSRSEGWGKAIVQLFRGCVPFSISHETLAIGEAGGIADILRKDRPDAVFHATALISPWLLSERNSAVARALQQAGFGVMLPAQILMIRELMLAVRELGMDCPVVNASYPDLTHPVLAAEGLAPTIGVGNAGMVLNVLKGELRSRKIEDFPRLFAHHAQVVAFAKRAPYAPGVPPLFFLDGHNTDPHSLVHDSLPVGSLLNALTASHAAEVIGALLSDKGTLQTSAPGPLGLPGGWPVHISAAGVELDLPPDFSIAEGVAYQNRAAVADGIAGIDPDGTVHFTAEAQLLLSVIAPELVEPLSGKNASQRVSLLRTVLEI